MLDSHKGSCSEVAQLLTDCQAMLPQWQNKCQPGEERRGKCSEISFLLLFPPVPTCHLKWARKEKNNNKPDLARAADALSFFLTKTDTGLTSTEPLPQRNNLRWWLLLHLPSLRLCLFNWASVTTLIFCVPLPPLVTPASSAFLRWRQTPAIFCCVSCDPHSVSGITVHYFLQCRVSKNSQNSYSTNINLRYFKPTLSPVTD